MLNGQVKPKRRSGLGKENLRNENRMRKQLEAKEAERGSKEERDIRAGSIIKKKILVCQTGTKRLWRKSQDVWMNYTKRLSDDDGQKEAVGTSFR